MPDLEDLGEHVLGLWGKRPGTCDWNLLDSTSGNDAEEFLESQIEAHCVLRYTEFKISRVKPPADAHGKTIADIKKAKFVTALEEFLRKHSVRLVHGEFIVAARTVTLEHL